METQDIRAELVRRKISIKTIASQLGVTSPSVSQVISRKAVSAKIRKAIAQAINKPVQEVFPENQETEEPT